MYQHCVDAHGLFVNKGDVTQLPIHDVIDDLITALAQQGRAVLCAPPGAGKTTFVPLAVHQAALPTGTIIMLQPLLLPPRASAERIAQSFILPFWQTVGFRFYRERSD